MPLAKIDAGLDVLMATEEGAGTTKRGQSVKMPEFVFAIAHAFRSTRTLQSLQVSA